MIVVKVGGSEGIDLDTVCTDVAAVLSAEAKLILVHGGSHLTNQVAEALGHPPRFVTSVSGYTSRRTDRRTLEIFEMVCCGQVNKGIVERLQAKGINAIGLSGLDGRLLEGKRKATLRIVEKGRRMVLRDDYTGKVEKVNTGLLDSLLDQGYVPVVAPVAISYEHEAVNVDGDRAAAAIGVAMQADALVILSNVPGLLEHPPDESSLVREVAKESVEQAMALAEGRMRMKLLGAAEAVRQGVGQVVLADGRVAQPIQRALRGEGTVIR
jgi:acetylglutamate/LysW-gamma-L-alpha-aminoadipate kinase